MAMGIKRSYAEMQERVSSTSLPPSRVTSPEIGHSRPGSPFKPSHNLPPPQSSFNGALQHKKVPRLRWDPDASIVLVGLQGSGKSSLAILAASAYNRRLIEFEKVFADRTGQTIAVHRHSVDITEHHRQHRHIFEQVLNEHSSRCVIVCSFADLERGGRLLRHFAQRHPVIHIVRDAAGISSQVDVWAPEKTAQMLAVSGRLLRSCTNYEFFNCTETEESAEHGEYVHPERANEDVDLRPATITPTVPFLKLKRAERDFLKFLRMILGDLSRTPSHQSAYPLSPIPVEHRRYTYAVVVRSSDILRDNINMEEVLVGADALQVVYDLKPSDFESDVPYMLGEVFSRARRATVLPMVLELDFDCYGTDAKDRNLYIQHLRYCLRFAPEYLIVNIDLEEMAFQDVVNLKGNTTIIAQASKVHGLPQKWEDDQCVSILERAQHAAADMVQLSADPVSMDDNAGVSAFRYKTRTNSLHVSAFNTGKLGRVTQCFNTSLTPVTSRSLQPWPNQSTRCQLTAQQATQALFASYVYDPLQFYILGGAVEFSLSPNMHNAAYQALGMPHNYKILSTSTPDVVRDLSADGHCGGFAITQPFKVEVLKHIKCLSKHASIIRAVNTILPVRRQYEDRTPEDLEIINTRNQAGDIHFLHGDNTDWIGIRACIRRGLSPINTVRSHSCGLIIGAGGMARASIYAMLHMGVRNIFIYSRTVSIADELANYYNNLSSDLMPGDYNFSSNGIPNLSTKIVHVINSKNDPWPAGFRPPTMIVSSVPAERNDNGKLVAPFTLPSDWLKSPTGGVLLEHTYEPLETDLVRQVRAESHRGWIVMTGLDMLPEQAFAQFELFTGRRAPRRIMRAEVLKALKR